MKYHWNRRRLFTIRQDWPLGLLADRNGSNTSTDSGCPMT